jgi:hypothetical protein
VPAHGLAPQNLSSDKRVDVCADSDEDRGSTPLASSLRLERSAKRRLPRRSKTKAGVLVATVSALEGYGLAGQPCSFIMRATRRTQLREMLTHCKARAVEN